MENITILPTLFDYQLSDETDQGQTISKQQAETIMSFFAKQPLFTWTENHNGCEARADAICVLLEAWNVPNYKAWVFSGYFLKKHVGGLKQNWNYHVAPMLQVAEDGKLVCYVVDPATSSVLQTMYDWAVGVTDYPHSYHLIKDANRYIFSDKKITAGNWNARNRQNRKWMIQGLAGINGLNAKGKAALVFNKGRIKKTWHAFSALKKENPFVAG